MAKKEKAFSYDSAIEEIESIVSKLESDNNQSSFDDMIADVEKALGLLTQCKKNIGEAEAKLAKLSQKAEEEE